MRPIFDKPEMKSRRRQLRRDATLAEKLLWHALRNLKIENLRVQRQYSIDDFVVDFYAPRARLAIEVDGITHESHEAAARDRWRQRIIESYGIEFFRVTDEAIFRNVGEVCDAIEKRMLECAGIREEGVRRRKRKERLPRKRLSGRE